VASGSKGTPSRPRQAAGTVSLVLGGALVQAAASAPLIWQMATASGATVGGDLADEWLPRITAAMTAVGAMLGGWLADRGRHGVALAGGAVALGVGSLVATNGTTSDTAALVGLGLLASLGAGCLLAAGVVRTLALAGALRALTVGATLSGGLLVANQVFSSASFLSLSRGTEWLFGHMAWITVVAGLVGTMLLGAAGRLGTLGSSGDGSARLPLLGPKPAGEGFQATGTYAFWVLVGLAVVASMAGIATQRGVAALAMEGLPESSFGSAVLAGMVLAKWRVAGPLLGGLLHDVLGPRGGVGLTAAALGVVLVVMTRYSGLEAPWDELAATMGVASGMSLAVVPAACLFLLGSRHVGYHFGLLYLGFAVGEVVLVPLAPVIAESAVPVLAAIGVAGVIVAGLALRLRVPTAPTEAAEPKAE